MTDTVKGIQNISLEMLKIFIDICKKNNLRYFLLGGTCLGAVRHKGFIPWDDDIDVGMPRKDYQQFIKIAQDSLPQGYFCQNFISDKNFPMNFTKIRNSNTTFIEKSLQKLDINHGVYLDIFPLDGYKSDKKTNRRLKTLTRRVSCVFSFPDSPVKSFFRKIAKFLITFWYAKDYKTARDKIDCLIRKYDFDESELVNNFSGAWGEREIVPNNYFGNGTMGSFEGLDVILPEKYDLYLKCLYGDYMQLPPEEKRVGHHYATVIDLEKSYRFYMKD